MNITDIQKRLDAMVKAMDDAGLRLPEAYCQIDSGSGPRVILNFGKSPKSIYADDGKYMDRTKPFAEQLDEADAWIAALPDPSAAGKREYLGALSDALEIGRKHALEDELLTPVKDVMQTVSKGLLAAPGVSL